MLQLVTAEEPRHERSQSPIIPVLAPLEEDPGPAGVLSASPERRHPRAIGHARPKHTRQKSGWSVEGSRKMQKRGTSMAVLRVWIYV